MGRLNTNSVLMFRGIPTEQYANIFGHGVEGIPPEWEGQRVAYRHGLVLWLNRALSRTLADREAAERVGALINGLNGGNARWSNSDKIWIPRSRKSRSDSASTAFKSLSERAPYYKFEIDLFPSRDGVKWELNVNCVEAPSGEGKELRARFDDLEAQDAVCNPELLAVEAVIHTALEGRLGTIRQCEVSNCSKWFLTKDDARVRCCPDHDVDELRRGTPKRKQQVKVAATRARDRERAAERKHWNQSKRKDKLVRPGPHRAKK